MRALHRAGRGARWCFGLLGLALGGCIAVATQGLAVEKSFSATLHQCRMQQPGRLNRRLALAATRPSIAQCLRRRGWTPDGSPVLRP
jgi:hypothetical protein